MTLALHSELLWDAGFAHAFFTRQGGVSVAPWESLNFSLSVGDSTDAVAENLTRAAAELGVRPERVFTLSQVHGTAAWPLRPEDDRERIGRLEGDITLSTCPTLACAVRVADCVPILLADRRSGAVAAVHGGWRGIVRGVVSAAVAALESLTRAPLDLICAIGPHIEQCCFEVSPEVASTLAACSPLGWEAVDRLGPKPRVALRQIVTAELLGAAGRRCVIDQVPGCTVCDPTRFHSFRRDGERSGRMLAAIVARSH